MEIHKIWHNGKLVYDSTKVNKPDNRAPKNIKGDYDLSIHGNKIVLVDNADGTTVEARCHPHDNFDIGEGMKEAFKRLNVKREEDCKYKEEKDKEIKVGDWVEVVNPGMSYSTLYDFFENNNLMKYATRYRFAVTPNNGVKGRVVAMKDEIYVIEVNEDYEFGNKNYEGLNCYNTIYLIGYDGLKKVNKHSV